MQHHHRARCCCDRPTLRAQNDAARLKMMRDVPILPRARQGPRSIPPIIISFYPRLVVTLPCRACLATVPSPLVTTSTMAPTHRPPRCAKLSHCCGGLPRRTGPVSAKHCTRKRTYLITVLSLYWAWAIAGGAGSSRTRSVRPGSARGRPSRTWLCRATMPACVRARRSTRYATCAGAAGRLTLCTDRFRPAKISRP